MITRAETIKRIGHLNRRYLTNTAGFNQLTINQEVSMNEKMYMNRETGSVDDYDGWYDEDGQNAVDRGEVIEVKKALSLYSIYDAITDTAIDEYQERAITKDDIKDYAENALGVYLSSEHIDTIHAAIHTSCDDLNEVYHKIEKPLSAILVEVVGDDMSGNSVWINSEEF